MSSFPVLGIGRLELHVYVVHVLCPNGGSHLFGGQQRNGGMPLTAGSVAQL
jgi:hypothetical protein